MQMAKSPGNLTLHFVGCFVSHSAPKYVEIAGRQQLSLCMDGTVVRESGS